MAEKAGNILWTSHIISLEKSDFPLSACLPAVESKGRIVNSLKLIGLLLLFSLTPSSVLTDVIHSRSLVLSPFVH